MLMNWSSIFKAFILFIAVVVFFFLLLGLVWTLQHASLGTTLSLPLLSIVGIMALVGLLAIVAIAFSLTNLSDRTQAMGLPNGSVRAVLALSLVVLFAVLTVYLFGSLNDSGEMKRLSCLTMEGATKFEKNNPDQFITAKENEDTGDCNKAVDRSNDATVDHKVAATGSLATNPPAANPSLAKPASPPASPPANAASGDKGDGDAKDENAKKAIPFYTVYYKSTKNTAAEDFAKQLLVLIGTLVTSVSGFYFGSKATSDAQGIASGLDSPPTIRGVQPLTFLPGDSGALTIMGTSLNSVQQAQLVSGDQKVTDPNVTSNSTQVLAKFDIPTNATVGKWDVVVIDFLGRQARLPGAVEITQPPAQQSGEAKPPG